MKVIDLTEFYSERGGGVRSHLTTKGHVLCQLGHDHAVIAPGPRDEERVLARRDGGGRAPSEARVIRIGGPAMPYDATYHVLARLDKIRAHVNRESPDVLEVDSPYLALAGALASGRRSIGARTLFWHADHLDTYVRPMLERAAPSRVVDAVMAPAWAGVRALTRPFDATLAAGKSQVDKLRAHGVANVHHVPFGVDKGVFSKDARSAARRRELLGDGHEADALLVASGRFAVEKRFDVLIDAFCMLRARGARAVLAIFGDGPERASIEAQVRGRDDVRFPGFETDRARLASAFASADVFVHSCPYETFGLSVAEAMATGTPVVVPDQGGACESIDPRSSAVYPSLDASAFAAGIERMLARDRDELRASAEAAAKKVLAVEDHFEDVLDIYRELLARGRPSR